MKKLIWIYVLLMVAPMMANATTSTDGVTSGAGTDVNPYIMRLDVNTQTISAVANEVIADFWEVELVTGGLLEVTFASQTIVPLSVVINGFQTNFQGAPDADGIYSLDLAAGIYQFGVVGTAGFGIPLPAPFVPVGGLYSVTTAFSAIPLPASLWLFSTALIGMMLSRNRKSA